MSKFIVSARKYRPTKFEDVIGQNHIAKTLQNAFQTDQLAHAFLFCGPRGVGKTTCARILAKVINCLNPVNKVEPCNTCSSCKAFNENASFNIFELDAASNNSVEHIRTLIEQVRYQPQHGTHKVFIIDEVHMLSTQAFNAFLKTLEEPPPYAIFILATTEKHKIIPTILSRCQIFDFKRIQPNDIVLQLEKICKDENKEAEHEALYQIAVKADGGMRDALSIFDKVAGATEGKITYKDVVSNLNLLDYDYYFQIVEGFTRSDLSKVLNLLDEIVKNGFDLESFVLGLSEHFRELLLCKEPSTIHIMECSDALKQRYYDQAMNIKEGLVLTAMNILNICDLTLSRANNKRLHTEIALSKITYAYQAYETDFLAAPTDAIKKKMMITN
jgi:DNA polymerase-3 subunit gamma/tau